VGDGGTDGGHEGKWEGGRNGPLMDSGTTNPIPPSPYPTFVCSLVFAWLRYSVGAGAGVAALLLEAGDVDGALAAFWRVFTSVRVVAPTHITERRCGVVLSCLAPPCVVLPSLVLLVIAAACARRAGSLTQSRTRSFTPTLRCLSAVCLLCVVLCCLLCSHPPSPCAIVVVVVVVVVVVMDGRRR
jgi:hypothetical protein